MVAKTNEQKEYAAGVFIKWLTAAEQNMRFVANTGYLPVTKQAFEEDMPAHLEKLENPRVRMMLTSVLSMYDEYTFFTAPTYSSFDADSDGYETDFKAVLTDERGRYLAGEATSPEAALAKMKQ